MIASIQGKIILKTDKFVVIETNGIGYKINVSPDTLLRINKLAHSTSSGQNEKTEIFSFWTHLHVREDAQDLYGFLDYQELEFFEMLINVSGIGPKGALTILGVATIETLKKAIGTSDTAYLTKISGIGRKTAEKIVLELRDKVGKEIGGAPLQQELDALEALKSLGYSGHEAREALKGLASEMNINTKIREALKVLGKR